MNLIPVIREALGLQENEEFKIKDEKGVTIYYKYRFTNDDMQVNIRGYWESSTNEMIGMLVTGQSEAVKLPFKPKEGETYYYVSLYYGATATTSYATICRSDVARANSGNCYRTYEEAEKHIPEWMERVYGKDWKELLK